MFNSKIPAPVTRRHSPVRSRILALGVLIGLSFCRLQGAVVKLPQAETKATARVAAVADKGSSDSQLTDASTKRSANTVALTMNSLTSVPEITVLFPIIGLV